MGSRFQILRTWTWRSGCGVSSSGLCVFHCSNSSSNPLRSSLFLHIQYLITSLQIYYIQLCCECKQTGPESRTDCEIRRIVALLWSILPLLVQVQLQLQLFHCFITLHYLHISGIWFNFFFLKLHSLWICNCDLIMQFSWTETSIVSQHYLFTVLLPLLFVLSFQLLHYIMIAYIVEDFVQFFLKLHCI